jgi:hypothetical protein
MGLFLFFPFHLFNIPDPVPVLIQYKLVQHGGGCQAVELSKLRKLVLCFIG